MEFELFISRVGTELKKTLPGRNSQLKMSSMRWLFEMTGSINPRNPMESSVLILLYPFDNDIFTVLIKRPVYNGVHSGQISFPGGKHEPDDQDLQATALREAHEEVGIVQEEVKIIGKLTDLYIPPSKYLVTPFVGWIPQRPSFISNPEEVEELIEVSIRHLYREETISVKKINLPLGVHLNAPAFVIGKHVIWGATAMILSEFLDVIRES